MQLPKSWAEVTIGQFIEARQVLSAEYTLEIDRQVNLLAVFSGKGKAEIEDMPMNEFKQAVERLAFLSDPSTISTKIPAFFTLKGRIYDVHRNMNTITAYQFADLSSLTADPKVITDNMHKILAVLCVPRKYVWMKGKYDGEAMPAVAELFYRRLSIEVAHPLCVFFCNLLPALQKTTLDYSEKQLRQMEKTMLKELKTIQRRRSHERGAGTSPSTRLPEGIGQNGISSET